MLIASQRAWCQALRTAQFLAPAVLVALLLVVPVRAADEQPPEENVFHDNTEQVVRGAATLAGVGCQGGGGTPMVVALIVRGDQEHLWKIEESDHALPLSPGLLKRVKDQTEIRIDDAGYETEAYCEAVYKSTLVSLGAFANSAHEATFREVFFEPKRFRGDVIHYKGTLRSVREFEAPLMLSGKGIKRLYECWIFDKEYGANPVCLVCPELPAGIKPGEKLSVPVSFDAYFFKKYRYHSVDSTPGHDREAPLFIGRSFVVLPPPKAEADATREEFTAGSKTLLLIFLAGVLLTVVLAAVAHWWLHRNDRHIRERIIRAAQFADLTDPEPAPPAAPSTDVTDAPPARANDDALLTQTGPEAPK
jgi:hypothetical protein